jgi:hypothetical protein
MSNQHTRKGEVCEAGHKHYQAIKRHRRGSKVISAHPARNERYQRQPEQQMEVGPKDATVDRPSCLQHVMVIVPVNADKNKAQRKAQKYRDHRAQGGQLRSMRHLQDQDHDGDDDGNHTIAERL